MARRSVPKPGEAKLKKVDATKLAITRTVGEKAKSATKGKGKVKALDGTIGTVGSTKAKGKPSKATEAPAQAAPTQGAPVGAVDLRIPVRSNAGDTNDTYHFTEMGKVGDELHNNLAQARMVAENSGLVKNIGTVTDDQSVAGTTFKDLEDILGTGHAHLQLAESAAERGMFAPTEHNSLDESRVDRSATRRAAELTAGTPGLLTKGDEDATPSSAQEYMSQAALHYASVGHILHHLTSSLNELTGGSYPVFPKEKADELGERAKNLVGEYAGNRAWAGHSSDSVRTQEEAALKTDETRQPGVRAQASPIINKLFPGISTVANDREAAAREGQARMEGLVRRRAEPRGSVYSALGKMAENVAMSGVPHVDVPSRLRVQNKPTPLVASVPRIGEGGDEYVMAGSDERKSLQLKYHADAFSSGDIDNPEDEDRPLKWDKVRNISPTTEGHLELAKQALIKRAAAMVKVDKARTSNKIKNAQGYEYNAEDRQADVDKAQAVVDKHTETAIGHFQNAMASHNQEQNAEYERRTAPSALAPEAIKQNDASFEAVKKSYGVTNSHPAIREAMAHQSNALKALNSGDHQGALEHAQKAARTLADFSMDESDRIKNERLQKASEAIEDIKPSAPDAMETAAQRLSVLFNRRSR